MDPTTLALGTGFVGLGLFLIGFLIYYAYRKRQDRRGGSQHHDPRADLYEVPKRKQRD